MFHRFLTLTAIATLLATTTPSLAQTSKAEPTAQPTPAKATEFLSIYFDSGSASVSAEGAHILDQAVRTYRDGQPIIMLVSGGCDSTGTAAYNLRLSEQRAQNVLQALVARGIPVERFQLLAKGETEPAVPTPNGTAERRNRRVEISWR